MKKVVNKVRVFISRIISDCLNILLRNEWEKVQLSVEGVHFGGQGAPF